MTEEILSIREGFVNDDSVESFQYIEKDTDQGTGSLNNQTELTITYQNQDAWLFPGDSYLKIEGALKTALMQMLQIIALWLLLIMDYYSCLVMRSIFLVRNKLNILRM